MNEMFCRGLASMDRKASVNRVDTMASHALTQGGVHIRLGGSLHTEGGRGVSQAVSQAGSQWVSECDGLYTQPRTRRKSAQMHPPIHPSIHPSIHSRKHALIAMTRSDPHATIMSPPHIICQKKRNTWMVWDATTRRAHEKPHTHMDPLPPCMCVCHGALVR